MILLYGTTDVHCREKDLNQLKKKNVTVIDLTQVCGWSVVHSVL